MIASFEKIIDFWVQHKLTHNDGLISIFAASLAWAWVIVLQWRQVCKFQFSINVTPIKFVCWIIGSIRDAVDSLACVDGKHNIALNIYTPSNKWKEYYCPKNDNQEFLIDFQNKMKRLVKTLAINISRLKYVYRLNQKCRFLLSMISV